LGKAALICNLQEGANWEVDPRTSCKGNTSIGGPGVEGVRSKGGVDSQRGVTANLKRGRGPRGILYREGPKDCGQSPPLKRGKEKKNFERGCTSEEKLCRERGSSDPREKRVDPSGGGKSLPFRVQKEQRRERSSGTKGKPTRKGKGKWGGEKPGKKGKGQVAQRIGCGGFDREWRRRKASSRFTGKLKGDRKGDVEKGEKLSRAACPEKASGKGTRPS